MRPIKFVSNYSPMKSSRVHNFFLDLYDGLVADPEGDQLESESAAHSFICIINKEMGKCYLEEFRVYIYDKFPKHNLIDHIQKTGSKYMFAVIYDALGSCPYNSENIYICVQQIHDKFCKTNEQRQIVINLLRSKLDQEHTKGFSDYLFRAIPDHVLLPYLWGSN